MNKLGVRELDKSDEEILNCFRDHDEKFKFLQELITIMKYLRNLNKNYKPLKLNTYYELVIKDKKTIDNNKISDLL